MRCRRCRVRVSVAPGCRAGAERYECAELGIVVEATTLALEDDPADVTAAARDVGLLDTRGSGIHQLRPWACRRCGVTPQLSGMLSRSLVPATIQAAGRVLASHGALLLLAVAALGIGAATATGALLLAGTVVAMFALATMLHEVGHVAAFRLLAGGAPALFVARTSSARLVRPVLRRSADLVVTVAGPLAPGVVMAGWALWFPTRSLPFVVGVVLAVAHAAFLVVPGADNGAVRRVLLTSTAGTPGPGSTLRK